MSFEGGRLRASERASGGELLVEADVVVIGAGAGGCAAAAALAESGLSVALLEEGRHWEPADFQPRTTFALKHLYQARGARTLRGNAVIPLPGGRGVGGSTLINSAICFRCPPEVLRAWRDDHGCDALTDERFEAYFDRIWQTLGVGVNPVEVQRNNNLIFKKGAEQLGLKGAFLARSAPGCQGCGICQYGCPSGGKFSADRTFLSQALATGRVAAWSDCRVRSATRHGDRVTEVSGDVLDPETQEVVGHVRARADTFVLAGGPIQSPLFLLANRFADHTHCGEHLVVHPTVGSLARFPWPIEFWRGVTQGYYVDCWDQGFLLQTYTTTPDQTYLTLHTRLGQETMEVMSDLASLASAGTLVHDEDSHGAVRHTPIGPDLSYWLGEGDKRRIIDGMRLCAKVFFAAGATEVFPGRIGIDRIRSPEEIEGALPYDLDPSVLMLYASHPMGTCRMGADPATSVVDPHGRVWGMANLRVADASIFPSSLGVNPQVTTMAMGLHVGHAIAGRV
ncbi:MAG: GMC family oxidoreductase [Alphaproteobacteria bacterium]|nr:GMC family oxidoreductase [Alphaproteobacteria bacterium]MCB9696577.1 GMC family oxidoreductase [Alphaproteobacteria bacterium]